MLGQNYLKHQKNKNIIKYREKEIKIKVNVPEGYEAIWNDKENKIEFKKLNEPKTWEEYCKRTKLRGKWFIDEFSDVRQVKINTDDTFDHPFDKAYMDSKEEAEAFLALMQLRLLRKAWIGDWEPNVDLHNYNIYNYDNTISIQSTLSEMHCLSFPTKEMAKEFLECFKDLLEKAKILL